MLCPGGRDCIRDISYDLVVLSNVERFRDLRILHFKERVWDADMHRAGDNFLEINSNQQVDGGNILRC